MFRNHHANGSDHLPDVSVGPSSSHDDEYGGVGSLGTNLENRGIETTPMASSHLNAEEEYVSH